MTPVTMRRDGGLAVVTFDSPPLNLFDAALSGELTDVLSELEPSPPGPSCSAPRAGS